jgi:hypothetical protein
MQYSLVLGRYHVQSWVAAITTNWHSFQTLEQPADMMTVIKFHIGYKKRGEWIPVAAAEHGPMAITSIECCIW